MRDIWGVCFVGFFLREDVNLNCIIKTIYYFTVLSTLGVLLCEKKIDLYCSEGETI